MESAKIKIICKNCGKEFEDYKSNHRQFCCYPCKSEYQIKKADGHKIKKCAGCGKTFRPKENRTRFCGLDCWYNYTRENSYTKIARKCKWCGKDFYPTHYKDQYCSKACGYKWYTEYKNTDEQIRLQAERTIRSLCNGLMKETLTKPHVAINELLENMCIQYINEYNIKYYAVDIYLPDSELMIEVMGDYWHSNPTTKHRDAKSISQKETISRDKRKHTYVRNQYGLEILYLWESDIKDNIEKCKELIELYIGNDGILGDYNSYNYELSEDGLILKQDIVQPLFLRNKNDVA